MADELDLSQFKEVFVSEAKEHLSALNAHLLDLEKNPQNTDLLNDIFRVSHTLKGMAATMGFEKVTELTHSMENVLDKLRSKKFETTPETIDLLFDCFDVLELLLEEIIEGQDKGANVKTLVERLQAVHSLNQAMRRDEPAVPPAPPQAQGGAPQQETQAGIQSPQGAPAEVKTDDVSSIHKSQTVRVRVEHLDKLMNVVGELVIAKARLGQIAEKKHVSELTVVINEISQFTIELQEEVLKTRMVPVKTIFDRYPRMMRDLAHKLGKEIEFVMTGTDIEIDRMLLDQINEPLVHLLRNAADHGIEIPETRKLMNKPATGMVHLDARREKGYVWIEVSDDGKGMDVEELKRKAIEKGIINFEMLQQMTENEAFMLVCHPGFSLAKEVTDVSGRGVGMDVVRNLVDAFNGKLEIKSKKGSGSTFIIQLPLTLAIIQALLVEVNGEIYAISLTNVSEIIRVEQEHIKTIETQEVLLLRDDVIPLVQLYKIFNASERLDRGHQHSYAVIVEINNEKIGLIVDNMIGKQEIVIKTLSGILRYAKNFGGATILADGRVVLIIDVASLYGA